MHSTKLTKEQHLTVKQQNNRKHPLKHAVQNNSDKEQSTSSSTREVKTRHTHQRAQQKSKNKICSCLTSKRGWKTHEKRAQRQRLSALKPLLHTPPPKKRTQKPHTQKQKKTHKEKERKDTNGLRSLSWAQQSHQTERNTYNKDHTTAPSPQTRTQESFTIPCLPFVPPNPSGRGPPRAPLPHPMVTTFVPLFFYNKLLFYSGSLGGSPVLFRYFIL